MHIPTIKILLLLLALLCAFHPSPLCEAAVCYVKPTEPHNVTCPSEPCYTLDEYAHMRNSTGCIESNIVFMFLSGQHSLGKKIVIGSSDVHNITLRPYTEKDSVAIIFLTQSSLVFELASDIVIRDINFSAISITFDNCTNVTLTRLTGQTFGENVQNAAIVLNNVIGTVNISYFKCILECYFGSCNCIVFDWTNTYFPYSEVLLHKLDVYSGGDSSYGYNYVVSFTGCFPGQIVIMNFTITEVFNHLLGGISITVNSSCKDLLFECRHTIFENIATGLSVTVLTPQYYHERKMAVNLHNVSYHNNYVALYLENVQNVTISNCFFKNTSVGAITATNSILSLMGNVTFIDNRNIEGGAMALLGNSRILIPEPNNTYILFKNNIADDVGGAIYYSASDTYVIGYCKIYVEQNLISSKTVLNFSINTAVNGGNAIYGALLNDYPCYSPNGTLVHYLSDLILHVAFFSPSLILSKINSEISSDALTVCICDEYEKLGNCEHDRTPLSVYPGQVFRLPVAALGDMNGLVKWFVYAKIDPTYSGKFSDELQHTQITNADRCTYFHYAILSKARSVTVKFSLEQSMNYYSNPIVVGLLDCPVGFALSTSEGCECHDQLSQNIENITCNITEQSIQRQGTTWIGVLENTSNGTLVFSNVCPFFYCNISHIKVVVKHNYLLDEDIQCADNRSGVLCGGCRDNFSLVLGSNRCFHGCSNNSLSLIIAFAAAGIALVFFIKILNLTVSQGTINGLIFYANIVGAEQTVLFSSSGFLSVFIAWLNLDLGIETCFFKGMGSYTKAWLQFVFPVYIWSIALFIIILSHYSIRASKLFGNNSVPVLATLILLSYSKLLRAVISALSVTDIQFLNGSTMSVWEMDGNIQYLTGKHIPLFVFAIAVLILLWFPFTLILVSIQWLQRGTHYRVLRWVTKLRPFFEAFTGPLKDKRRYWVGALLLVRCTLLLVFYLYTANGSGVAFISIMFAVLIILAATGSVYKNYYVTVLETSCFFNLGTLATGTLYVQYITDSGNQEALVMTSVGIAFLQFLAIVIYHLSVLMREPLKKLKIKVVKMRGQNEPERDEYEPLDESLSVWQPLERPPYQEISNFREPLLADLND